MIAKGAAQSSNLIRVTVACIVHSGMSLVRRSRSGIVAVVDHQTNDHASRPLPFFVSWGLPILILIGSNFLQDMVPLVVIVGILSAAMFWMGAACVLNARRCRRRHCFLFWSGLPVGRSGGGIDWFRHHILGRRRSSDRRRCDALTRVLDLSNRTGVWKIHRLSCESLRISALTPN